MTAPAFSFTVPGNPVSVNNLYPTGRGGRRFTSRAGASWKQAVGMLAKVAGARLLAGPVRVEIRAFFSSRRPDLDGAAKAILDGLSGVAYADDRQVHELLMVKGLDPKNPRAEVKVWGLGP